MKSKKKVIVLGGGVIGVEFASIWRSFGAKVHIVEALPHLIPNEDEALSKGLERAFRKRGIEFTNHVMDGKPDELREMITTPSASMPTNSKPMAVSSFRAVWRCTSSMPSTITPAAMAAPRKGEKSNSTAAAMPGTTPCTKASPKKLMPRSTSQVPTTDAITPATMPPIRARCWKPSANGSNSQSITGPG